MLSSPGGLAATPQLRERQGPLPARCQAARRLARGARRAPSGRCGAPVDGVEGLVGNTPLVRIRSLSELTGCEVRCPRLPRSTHQGGELSGWATGSAPGRNAGSLSVPAACSARDLAAHLAFRRHAVQERACLSQSASALV